MPTQRDTQLVVGDAEKHRARAAAVRDVLGGVDGGEPLGVVDRAVATRGEATRETLATELESALDEIDVLRRRDPPPRPAVDRRSVSAPVEAVASLEADLDALRRDVASLRPRQQVSRPTWLLFAAAGVALTAWILTPDDPYAAALAS